MRKIPLTQGKFALVDDEDYEWLMQWKWYAIRQPSGVDAVWYAVRKTSKTIRMHRVITKAPATHQVDHANRNGLDNRRKNLRIATSAQNQANKGMQKNNTTGFKGVSRCVQRIAGREYRYIRARIQVDRRSIELGNFKTTEEAAQAYAKAAKKYYGAFARTR